MKIDFTKINVWITSDTHFSHKNICRGVTEWRNEKGEIPLERVRDFDTIEKMNDTIVNNINNVVGQDDLLIHLGDFSFGGFENIQKFWDRLICKNINIIPGNHDHHITNDKDGIRGLFLNVDHYDTIPISKGCSLILFHYPILSWDGLGKGNIHLHGHSHLPNDKKFGVGRRMDIGIDGHPDFRPYHLMDEVVPMMRKREIKSDLAHDHHMDEM